MFAVVTMALLMSSLDATIVATALDTLRHGLNASITWVGWTITAYSLGLVVALPASGQLADRYGARRVFLASVALFTAASLCCGLANNIYVLIALRAVQAVGGAGFTPSVTSIVVKHFGSARDRAVGLFGAVFTVGAMVGPVLGGLIVSLWSWRGVFLVNVPVGLILIPIALRCIPADTPGTVKEGARLDWSGLAVLGTGLVALMIGLTVLGDTPHGWIGMCAVLFPASAVALIGFVWHIRRYADPLIPPRLIYGRGFAAVNGVNVIYGAAAGLIALIPLYATIRYGIDAFGSAVLLVAEGVGAIISSSLGALLLRRTGYRRPINAGSVLTGVGMIMLAVPPTGLGASGWLAVAAGLVGLGGGWASPASRNAGLQLIPDQAASLAALRSTVMQVGSITAISVVTAILAQAAVPSLSQAWTFAAFAAVMVTALPAAARIPDYRGSW